MSWVIGQCRVLADPSLAGLTTTPEETPSGTTDRLGFVVGGPERRIALSPFCRRHAEREGFT